MSLRFSELIKYISLSLFLLISTPSFALEKVSLQLKWMHQFQFAGYYVAKEKGFYENEGFDVEIRERNPKSSPFDDVDSGRADYGIADSSVVLQRLKGKPVVIASTVFQESPLIFMSLKSANITSVYDLFDKRIMFQRSIDDAVLTAMMALADISDIDYTHVPHNFDNMAIIKGDVDVMSAYKTDQVLSYKDMGVDLNILDPSSYGIDFYGDLIFTSESNVRKKPERVRAFVRASLKGWQYALDHPEEAVDLIIEKYNKKAVKKLLLLEAEATKSVIKSNYVPLGTMHEQRFNRIANVYKNLALVANSSSLDGLTLSSYENTARQLSTQTLIVMFGGVIILILILISVIIFNYKLKGLVKEKTKELSINNIELANHIDKINEKNSQLKVAKLETESVNNLLEISNQQLRELATIDELTKIPNRRLFNSHLQQEWLSANRSSTDLALIVCDIDNFKLINDEYGHQIGDESIRYIANVLKSFIRRPREMVARIGGEEFAIILPNTNSKYAIILAEKIIAKLSSDEYQKTLPKLSNAVTLSMGVSINHPKVACIQELFKNSDNALYLAKISGKNCVKSQ